MWFTFLASRCTMAIAKRCINRQTRLGIQFNKKCQSRSDTPILSSLQSDRAQFHHYGPISGAVLQQNYNSGHSKAIQQHQRRYLRLPNPFRKRQDFRPIDKVPDHFECVYNPTTNLYITYVYPFTVFGTVSALYAGLRVLLEHSQDQVVLFGLVTDNILKYNWQLVAVTLPVMTIFTYLVASISQKFPLRFYYDEEDDMFIAIFATLFPWKTKQLQFRGGAVQHLCPENDENESDESSLTAFLNAVRGEYALGKRRLTINPHSFKYPMHYNALLGYTNRSYPKDEKDDYE